MTSIVRPCICAMTKHDDKWQLFRLPADFAGEHEPLIRINRGLGLVVLRDVCRALGLEETRESASRTISVSKALERIITRIVDILGPDTCHSKTMCVSAISTLQYFAKQAEKPPAQRLSDDKVKMAANSVRVVSGMGLFALSRVLQAPQARSDLQAVLGARRQSSLSFFFPSKY